MWKISFDAYNMKQVPVIKDQGVINILDKGYIIDLVLVLVQENTRVIADPWCLIKHGVEDINS